MITVDSPKSIKINGTEYPCVDNYNEIYNLLKDRKTILHWEEGNSLFPIIKNMEYCKISPVRSNRDVKIGDCVFCRLMNGSFMVHRVTDIVKREGEGIWYKIGNTWDETYGWTKEVFGIAESTDIFEKYHPKYYN